MYRDELELFADSVRGGAECELSAANGCQALAAVHAALASVKQNGRAIKVNEMIAATEAHLAAMRE